MRSRAASRRLKLLGIGAALFLAVGLFLLLRPGDADEPTGAAPNTLAHMAEKNRDAATTIAARQRLQAEASTNAANALVSAEGRSAASGSNAENSSSGTAPRHN